MSVEGWQARFAGAVLDPEAPVPGGVGCVRGEADPLRFAVYRNNVHAGLVSALLAGFPAVARVVGEAFFSSMARAYVAQAKPRSPVMMFYGEDFSDFIAEFPPAAGLPYLPDLARLEYLCTQSYHAADAAVLDMRALAEIGEADLAETVLRLHPAARLLASPYAVGSIWSVQRGGQGRKVAADRRETVLITRPRAEVRLTVVPEQDVAFIEALNAGATLGTAAEAALAADGRFDFGRALAGLCALGAFRGKDGA
ncbi:DNA-binding domain-containing protein [Pelagibacterium limicola]|uniref:HvfC/BufC N-terminal domain-containing protein n=1 Tax=Pelagibacterium limicola TaxID=2791022 RepID=UPI0018AFE195|nr:DNA-binding domain-containing protein [Pelagibacterium limicola]